MTEVPADADAQRALAVWGWQRETLVIDDLGELLAEASCRRDAHVKALYDTGLVYRDIGELLGVTQARIGQIMARVKSRTDQPEEKNKTPSRGTPRPYQVEGATAAQPTREESGWATTAALAAHWRSPRR